MLSKIVFLDFALFQNSIYGYFISNFITRPLKENFYTSICIIFYIKMNYLTHQLLNSEELEIIRKELNKEELFWEDGKQTAGKHAAKVKIIYNLEKDSIYEKVF